MTLSEARRLMGCAERFGGQNYMAAAAILLYAGIRPREVRRLKWRDIDIAENSITVRSACSKTGGARQVEICPALKVFLGGGHPPEISVCPPDWPRRWKRIRDGAGFGNAWVQDVLRHTYASYHAKRFRDLPRLQADMGHRDLSLLRSRYVNMRGISSSDASAFFEGN